MGSFKPHTFDPLVIGILDLVYQAALGATDLPETQIAM